VPPRNQVLDRHVEVDDSISPPLPYDKEARAESDTNYDKASAAAASQRILSEEDRAALNLLWRKLVKLYHPDRFAREPEKKAAFEKLTAAINQARDQGPAQAGFSGTGLHGRLRLWRGQSLAQRIGFHTHR
jgi:hypothetical protein